ncbi:MAG: metallophosphoesterase [Oscillospiraceae bacterium]
MAERKHRHGKLYLLLMALAAAGAAIWVGSSVLSVEEFAFTGARLPAGWDGGRLVVLSDLHGKRFGRQNSRLLEAVRKAGPDVICLCGDMMDEWSGTEYLRPLLEGLVEIAPVYYVTGNHEWASGRMPEMRQLLEETGVTYLSNTFVPLERNGDTITLAGIDDPNGYAGQKSPEEVAGEVKEAAGDGFWLLMAHRNNLFDGNTAGWGRIWCCRATARRHLAAALTDGLLGAGGQLLPSFTNGFYCCTDGHEAQVFVTRGLGGIPRLFNHPQVAVLTLHCE